MLSLLRRYSIGEHVRGPSPFAGWILAGEYEASRAGAGKATKIACNVLASSSLRINDSPYLLRKLVGRYRGRAMMLPPAAEKPNDLLSAGIVGLKCFDALDRIATSQGDQGVAAPFCPGFEATKRLASRENGCVLATPPPDGKSCGEKLGTSLLDQAKKSWQERT
jgi:hypothetical protein